jgi:hypothetical protein
VSDDQAVEPLREMIAQAIQPEIFNCFVSKCSWLDHEVGPEATLIAIDALKAIRIAGLVIVRRDDVLEALGAIEEKHRGWSDQERRDRLRAATTPEGA